MNRDYKNILLKIWDLTQKGASAICQECDNAEFHKDQRTDFEKNFISEYDHIADNYMEKSEEPLDRHKVAAIIIVSIIKSNILTGEAVDGCVFFGNYILAMDTALIYMLDEINKRLISKEKGNIANYFFPKAMSCETDYHTIFFRNLYFANQDEGWRLNTLDIAEKLFLLEYMTLEKNGIDPSILNEY